uniref:IS110 family transposase n=1 Tax=Sulfurirhabdus autotrophica TaxID=1706046 RepID=UPI0010592531
MQKFHLGIDIAKAKLDCALRLPDGKFRSKVVENSPHGFEDLIVWLEKHSAASVHVCMEATGVYWEAVAEYLANQGIAASVVNPSQIKSFGRSRMVRTKTDKIDAQLIAEFCQERSPELWQAPSLSEQALRAMVLRLEALQTMRTQESNRLEVARDAVK